MFRRLMVIGLLGVGALVFALMFETSTAEARCGCRGRRVSSRAYYAPSYRSSYYRPRVSVGVGFYGGGYGHGGFGGYGGYGHGFYGGHGFSGGHW